MYTVVGLLCVVSMALYRRCLLLPITARHQGQIHSSGGSGSSTTSASSLGQQWAHLLIRGGVSISVITAPTGTVIMEATRNGGVEICVQSLSASHARPSLLHLSVTEDLTEKREQEREQSDTRHMSHLEKTVRGLIRRVTMIQKTAIQTKDQEYQFHQTTLQMNRAIKVWPVVHCIMLAVTGLFMAKHISTYLKGHHIY